MRGKVDKVPMKIGARVGIGILVIIAIMLTLTIVGLNYMFLVNMKMKGIVENINVKMEMAHVMQNTLRERSLSMYYMIIVKDDFLRDEEWQRFNKRVRFLSRIELCGFSNRKKRRR